MDSSNQPVSNQEKNVPDSKMIYKEDIEASQGIFEVEGSLHLN